LLYYVKVFIRCLVKLNSKRATSSYKGCFAVKSIDVKIEKEIL